jgi:hypothetical protein
VSMDYNWHDNDNPEIITIHNSRVYGVFDSEESAEKCIIKTFVEEILSNDKRREQYLCLYSVEYPLESKIFRRDDIINT